ncbi:Diaminopimelate decarboxylase [Planctomycetes bacterium Poly30]|uniref:Diaminopimelate decarboxylase n=1 Tax=Saltatorellus ferox TaxID=2528018 RepID=A0A518F0D2_9BACT|nr:Diaminopimelate decarboxylase [Planctomycetes bacterium Poly30]
MKQQPAWASDEQLAEVGRRFGTPLYVYDLSSIQKRLLAFSGFDRVRYAVKANPNLAVLSALRQAGAVCDSVSKGEVDRALAAGFLPGEIVYTADLLDREARDAVAEHRLHVNAGSITMIDQVGDIGGFDSITLRINPGFGDGHDQKVTTGGPNSKHGIWHGSLHAARERAAARGLAVTGLHVHIGSGVGTDRLHDTIAAMGRAIEVFRDTVQTVSCGGGMSIPYRDTDTEFDVQVLATAWNEARERWSADLGRRLHLEVEPGRYLVAQSGVLLTEVCGINDTRTPGGDGSDGYTFILVDAGFHTLARPVLYGSYHRITALGKSGEPTRPQLVAGPLCESADVFTQAKDSSPAPQELPEVQSGDLLAIHDTGAYGASMASCYNSRPLPAEVVLTEDGEAHLAKPALDLTRLIEEERDALPHPLRGAAR